MLTADFTYALETVNGGQKLALIYRLVQRSARPLPKYLDTSAALHEMQELAQIWNREKLLPKRAIYVLENRYGNTSCMFAFASVCIRCFHGPLVCTIHMTT